MWDPSSYCKMLFSLVSLTDFFFYAAASSYFYTLSLHDALPISPLSHVRAGRRCLGHGGLPLHDPVPPRAQRPSADGPVDVVRSEEHTSEPSHTVISYAVFCLKKKKRTT